MTTKEKQLLKEEFLTRMKGKVCMVNGQGWSLPIDEYMEQERWARPVKPFDTTWGEKHEVKLTGDLGILSPECLFDTRLWYVRDRYNRDLSLRNERRRSK